MTAASTQPRVALVTGGSGGLGAAVALRLGADGYHVARTYRGVPALALAGSPT